MNKSKVIESKFDSFAQFLQIFVEQHYAKEGRKRNLQEATQ